MKELLPSNIIIVGGATCSGKTFLSIEISLFLKKHFGVESEIINADSIQIYDEMKILTSYPSKEDLAKVKHNLFGFLSADEESDVAFWLKKASEIIKQLYKEKKIAIICGGTGFYINAIINGISNIPDVPQNFRDDVLKQFNLIGRDEFFEKLSSLDPIASKILHKNDTQRILRAYEVASFTGVTLSEWQKKSRTTTNNALNFILLPDRQELQKKSSIRINKMLISGAIDEVKEFNERYPNYNGSLCNVIGYKEISENNSADVYYPLINNRTNQYIKRQSTWFRNQMKDAVFLHGFGNEQEIFNQVCNCIGSHFNFCK